MSSSTSRWRWQDSLSTMTGTGNSRIAEGMMDTDYRPGAVHWIDHFVVPTNDMVKWERFAETALGGHVHNRGGLTTGQYNRGGYIRSFYDVGRHELAAFLQLDILPTPGPLGQGLPRYGFYVRPGEIE